MKVSSRVTINSRRIKQLNQAAVTALEKTGEALHTEVVQAQVIPFDTGRTQGEGFFVDYADSSKGNITLVQEGPYARRLYFHPEFNFKTDNNPNARGEWFEPWIDGEQKEFAKKAYKEFYKRAGDV